MTGSEKNDKKPVSGNFWIFENWTRHGRNARNPPDTRIPQSLPIEKNAEAREHRRKKQEGDA